jgi:hypothetical protein
MISDVNIVPTDWRAAHVSPIYKKGSKYSPEKYRPISLACICCKILEHGSAIMTHTDKHNILYQTVDVIPSGMSLM